jgi:DNA-3-methyladenine glycosylase
MLMPTVELKVVPLAFNIQRSPFTSTMSKPLSREFFSRPTLTVARSLVGTYLVRDNGTGTIAGKIIEVEAYVGPKDKACHASKGRTPRTDVMFGPAGISYVYLIYGMYHCLNVVTERVEFPAAVLIRAVEVDGRLIDGPGRLCRALEIDRSLNRLDMTIGKNLWFEDRDVHVPQGLVGRFPRIGVDYAGEWAKKPWRFRLRTEQDREIRKGARRKE